MSEPNLREIWRDQTIYHILIDRFAGYDPAKDPLKPDYMGGNIAGIIENLDYIQELGATCIYLSPFIKGSYYDGYNPADFMTVDERYGTVEELKALADQIHGRGMKLMIDFVANHCSLQHPFFVDAQSNPESQYRDWFIFREWPNNYVGYFGSDILPKLNLDNPAAKTYMIEAAVHWVKLLDADAVRLDHVIGPPIEFWREFRAKLKAAKPEILLMAEVLLIGIDLHKSYGKALNIPVPAEALLKLDTPAQIEAILLAYHGIFDGYIDFSFYEIIQKFVRGQITIEQCGHMLKEHDDRTQQSLVLPALLDNHDVNRIMFAAKNDTAKVIDAITLQFSHPHPNFIYYGTELGMTQTQSDDPNPETFVNIYGRMPMPTLAERDLSNPIYKHYRKLLS